MQKQTSAGGCTQSVEGVGSGLCHTKRWPLEGEHGFSWHCPTISCVLRHSEQCSDTVPDQKCSGTAVFAQVWCVLEGSPGCARVCPMSGLLPQMATVGAGDSPKAMLVCPLLSIYLFFQIQEGWASHKLITQNSKHILPFPENTLKASFRIQENKHLWRTESIYLSLGVNLNPIEKI